MRETIYVGTLVLAFEDWWLSPPPHSRGTLPGPSSQKVGGGGARWRGRGRAVSPDCASVGKLRSLAKKVVRVGMCGEVQVDDLVCCCCRCVRKQDRGCYEVHSNTVVLDRHTPGRHLLREHLQLDHVHAAAGRQDTRTSRRVGTRARRSSRPTAGRSCAPTSIGDEPA